jgi:hypothetical protein
MTSPKPDPDFKRELLLQPFVIIESPFSGKTFPQRNYNNLYLIACCQHSMLSGEAPFASHGFYTQFLNDKDTFTRTLGIKLGQTVMARASFVAVYCDLGISQGMKEGIKAAHKLGLVIQRRKLGAPWKPWREDNG